MATHTLIADSDFSTLISQFNVGAFISSQAIESGIENTNYFVVTNNLDNSQEFVFTLFEEIPTQDLLPYLKLLRLLNDKDIKVAPPIELFDGSFYGEFKTKPFILSPRLLGKHLHKPSRNQTQQVAQELARIHSLPLQDIDLSKGIRSFKWLNQLLNRSSSSLINSTFEYLSSTLHEFIDMSNEFPEVIIHGDLFRDNVIFNGDTLSGIIDFFNASKGLAIFDLAILINDWAVYPNFELNREITEFIIARYEEIRPLTQQERKALPLSLKVAAMRFWISRLQNPSTKKPEEFEELFWFLDRCDWLDEI